MLRAFLTAALILSPAASVVAADPSRTSPFMSEPISYTLRFPAPQTHYVEIEARIPTAGAPAVELMMPVWIPGSYLIREYSRHVEGIAARTPDGADLRIEKTAKNRWRVETGGGPQAIVTYRLYCRELTVRTNFVDSSFALLNAPATFLTLADEKGPRPHELEVVPPAAWKVVISPLEAVQGPAGTFRFYAKDFDLLVDSPLYAGNGRLHDFTVAGKPHTFLNEGEQEEGGPWDGGRSARDVEAITRQLAAFWGHAPYPRYVLFNLLSGGGGGGLEHRDSTVLMVNRYAMRTRDSYVDWLSLVSHEVFHAWNGKRLRPVELGPFDYEREVYTPSLWQVEGMTSYYDDLLVHRAGLSSREEYLKRLSRGIEVVEGNAGRKVQTLEEASFDAWVKYYRRDENFANTGVNYYAQGSVVSFLVDAEIRRATGGKASLDDALRALYAGHSGERGFTSEDLEAAFSQAAGKDLAPFLRRLLRSTDDISYENALAWFGLRFTGNTEERPKADALQADKPAWLGIETDDQEGRLFVTQVPRQTPGFEAGINVGDEILAIGDYRVPASGLTERLKAYRPGETAALLVSRRDRLQRIPVTFGEKPAGRGRLEIDPKATPEQKAHLEAWLSGKEK